MSESLSPRLAAIVEALPLRPGLRILEIGCGPGAAAREIARRVRDGYVLAIDRSAKAILQARAASAKKMGSSTLRFRCVSIEDFELEAGEPAYDIAFAIRVGALDGRHPESEAQAKGRIKAALGRGGRFFIDGGQPLLEIPLNR